MKLYTNNASPFCRKVHVVLYETGLHDQCEMLSAIGHPLAPENMPTDQNPMGKIPVLIRADAGAIYDSRVICRYLDQQSEAGLYPESGLFDVLTLEATGDGICDAAILMIYEGRSRPEEMQYAPWVEAQWSKIERALDALEARWLPHLKAPLNAGQIAVGCALGYLDFRHSARDWRGGRPELAAWFEAFSERDAMQHTAPTD